MDKYASLRGYDGGNSGANGNERMTSRRQRREEKQWPPHGATPALSDSLVESLNRLKRLHESRGMEWTPSVTVENGSPKGKEAKGGGGAEDDGPQDATAETAAAPEADASEPRRRETKDGDRRSDGGSAGKEGRGRREDDDPAVAPPGTSSASRPATIDADEETAAIATAAAADGNGRTRREEEGGDDRRPRGPGTNEPAPSGRRRIAERPTPALSASLAVSLNRLKEQRESSGMKWTPSALAVASEDDDERSYGAEFAENGKVSRCGPTAAVAPEGSSAASRPDDAIDSGVEEEEDARIPSPEERSGCPGTNEPRPSSGRRRSVERPSPSLSASLAVSLNRLKEQRESIGARWTPSVPAAAKEGGRERGRAEDDPKVAEGTNDPPGASNDDVEGETTAEEAADSKTGGDRRSDGSGEAMQESNGMGKGEVARGDPTTVAPEGSSASQTGAIGDAEDAAAASRDGPMTRKPPSGSRRRAVERPTVLSASLAISLNRLKEQRESRGMTWTPTAFETAAASEAADSEEEDGDRSGIEFARNGKESLGTFAPEGSSAPRPPEAIDGAKEEEEEDARMPSPEERSSPVIMNEPPPSGRRRTVERPMPALSASLAGSLNRLKEQRESSGMKWTPSALAATSEEEDDVDYRSGAESAGNGRESRGGDPTAAVALEGPSSAPRPPDAIDSAEEEDARMPSCKERIGPGTNDLTRPPSGRRRRSVERPTPALSASLAVSLNQLKMQCESSGMKLTPTVLETAAASEASDFVEDDGDRSDGEFARKGKESRGGGPTTTVAPEGPSSASHPADAIDGAEEEEEDMLRMPSREGQSGCPGTNEPRPPPSGRRRRSVERPTPPALSASLAVSLNQLKKQRESIGAKWTPSVLAEIYDDTKGGTAEEASEAEARRPAEPWHGSDHETTDGSEREAGGEGDGGGPMDSEGSDAETDAAHGGRTSATTGADPPGRRSPAESWHGSDGDGAVDRDEEGAGGGLGLGLGPERDVDDTDGAAPGDPPTERDGEASALGGGTYGERRPGADNAVAPTERKIAGGDESRESDQIVREECKRARVSPGSRSADADGRGNVTTGDVLWTIAKIEARRRARRSMEAEGAADPRGGDGRDDSLSEIKKEGGGSFLAPYPKKPADESSEVTEREADGVKLEATRISVDPDGSDERDGFIDEINGEGHGRRPASHPKISFDDGAAAPDGDGKESFSIKSLSAKIEARKRARQSAGGGAADPPGDGWNDSPRQIKNEGEGSESASHPNNSADASVATLDVDDESSSIGTLDSSCMTESSHSEDIDGCSAVTTDDEATVEGGASEDESMGNVMSDSLADSDLALAMIEARGAARRPTEEGGAADPSGDGSDDSESYVSEDIDGHSVVETESGDSLDEIDSRADRYTASGSDDGEGSVSIGSIDGKVEARRRAVDPVGIDGWDDSLNENGHGDHNELTSYLKTPMNVIFTTPDSDSMSVESLGTDIEARKRVYKSTECDTSKPTSYSEKSIDESTVTPDDDESISIGSLDVEIKAKRRAIDPREGGRSLNEIDQGDGSKPTSYIKKSAERSDTAPDGDGDERNSMDSLDVKIEARRRARRQSTEEGSEIREGDGGGKTASRPKKPADVRATTSGSDDEDFISIRSIDVKIETKGKGEDPRGSNGLNDSLDDFGEGNRGETASYTGSASIESLGAKIEASKRGWRSHHRSMEDRATDPRGGSDGRNDSLDETNEGDGSRPTPYLEETADESAATPVSDDDDESTFVDSLGSSCVTENYDSGDVDGSSVATDEEATVAVGLSGNPSLGNTTDDSLASSLADSELGLDDGDALESSSGQFGDGANGRKEEMGVGCLSGGSPHELERLRPDDDNISNGSVDSKSTTKSDESAYNDASVFAIEEDAAVADGGSRDSSLGNWADDSLANLDMDVGYGNAHKAPSQRLGSITNKRNEKEEVDCVASSSSDPDGSEDFQTSEVKPNEKHFGTAERLSASVLGALPHVGWTSESTPSLMSAEVEENDTLRRDEELEKHSPPLIVGRKTFDSDCALGSEDGKAADGDDFRRSLLRVGHVLYDQGNKKTEEARRRAQLIVANIEERRRARQSVEERPAEPSGNDGSNDSLEEIEAHTTKTVKNQGADLESTQNQIENDCSSRNTSHIQPLSARSTTSPHAMQMSAYKTSFSSHRTEESMSFRTFDLSTSYMTFDLYSITEMDDSEESDNSTDDIHQRGTTLDDILRNCSAERPPSAPIPSNRNKGRANSSGSWQHLVDNKKIAPYIDGSTDDDAHKEAMAVGRDSRNHSEGRLLSAPVPSNRNRGKGSSRSSRQHLGDTEKNVPFKPSRTKSKEVRRNQADKSATTLDSDGAESISADSLSSTPEEEIYDSEDSESSRDDVHKKGMAASSESRNHSAQRITSAPVPLNRNRGEDSSNRSWQHLIDAKKSAPSKPPRAKLRKCERKQAGRSAATSGIDDSKYASVGSRKSTPKAEFCDSGDLDGSTDDAHKEAFAVGSNSRNHSAERLPSAPVPSNRNRGKDSSGGSRQHLGGTDEIPPSKPSRTKPKELRRNQADESATNLESDGAESLSADSLILTPEEESYDSENSDSSRDDVHNKRMADGSQYRNHSAERLPSASVPSNQNRGKDSSRSIRQHLGDSKKSAPSKPSRTKSKELRRNQADKSDTNLDIDGEESLSVDSLSSTPEGESYDSEDSDSSRDAVHKKRMAVGNESRNHSGHRIPSASFPSNQNRGKDSSERSWQHLIDNENSVPSKSLLAKSRELSRRQFGRSDETSGIDDSKSTSVGSLKSTPKAELYHSGDLDGPTDDVQWEAMAVGRDSRNNSAERLLSSPVPLNKNRGKGPSRSSRQHLGDTEKSASSKPARTKSKELRRNQAGKSATTPDSDGAESISSDSLGLTPEEESYDSEYSDSSRDDVHKKGVAEGSNSRNHSAQRNPSAPVPLSRNRGNDSSNRTWQHPIENGKSSPFKPPQVKSREPNREQARKSAATSGLDDSKSTSVGSLKSTPKAEFSDSGDFDGSTDDVHKERAVGIDSRNHFAERLPSVLVPSNRNRGKDSSGSSRQHVRDFEKSAPSKPSRTKSKEPRRNQAAKSDTNLASDGAESIPAGSLSSTPEEEIYESEDSDSSRDDVHKKRIAAGCDSWNHPAERIPSSPVPYNRNRRKESSKGSWQHLIDNEKSVPSKPPREKSRAHKRKQAGRRAALSGIDDSKPTSVGSLKSTPKTDLIHSGDLDGSTDDVHKEAMTVGSYFRTYSAERLPSAPVPSNRNRGKDSPRRSWQHLINKEKNFPYKPLRAKSRELNREQAGKSAATSGIDDSKPPAVGSFKATPKAELYDSTDGVHNEALAVGSDSRTHSAQRLPAAPVASNRNREKDSSRSSKQHLRGRKTSGLSKQSRTKSKEHSRHQARNNATTLDSDGAESISAVSRGSNLEEESYDSEDIDISWDDVHKKGMAVGSDSRNHAAERLRLAPVPSNRNRGKDSSTRSWRHLIDNEKSAPSKPPRAKSRELSRRQAGRSAATIDDSKSTSVGSFKSTPKAELFDSRDIDGSTHDVHKGAIAVDSYSRNRSAERLLSAPVPSGRNRGKGSSSSSRQRLGDTKKSVSSKPLRTKSRELSRTQDDHVATSPDSFGDDSISAGFLVSSSKAESYFPDDYTHKIHNAMQNHDHETLVEEFDSMTKAMSTSNKVSENSGGIPYLLVRMLCDLEDHVGRCFANKARFKKLSPAQGRALNRMKLSLLKFKVPYQRIIDEYRKNPVMGDIDCDKEARDVGIESMKNYAETLPSPPVPYKSATFLDIDGAESISVGLFDSTSKVERYDSGDIESSTDEPEKVAISAGSESSEFSTERLSSALISYKNATSPDSVGAESICSRKQSDSSTTSNHSDSENSFSIGSLNSKEKMAEGIESRNIMKDSFTLYNQLKRRTLAAGEEAAPEEVPASEHGQGSLDQEIHLPESAEGTKDPPTPSQGKSGDDLIVSPLMLELASILWKDKDQKPKS